MTMRRSIAATAVSAVLVLAMAAMPSRTEAFCGFYVSGAGGEMFNNATQVVLMRKGTRTVLSMQNNYQGPATDFAMVVPVPVVLREENVKTLPREVFARVDKLGAPRLVEYWEEDPCAPEPEYDERKRMVMPSAAAAREDSAAYASGLGVKIEAQFTVGEYEIVILSAKDSTGLDTWLRHEKYQIPPGAEALLRPYVEQDMKFFVAKVNPKKVTFKGDQAMLSPLRFHYDSDNFALPIRLGLANSKGTQDLIVSILAPGQRYEVQNYGNVTIPTNLDVKDAVRTRFGEFYAALFDRTLEKNPRSVVTEYAWDASSCDPCPEPALDGSELATLGADVLGGDPEQYRWGGGFVLTRLHARYTRDGVSEDLVFKASPPIVGGRERPGAGGKLEERSRPDSQNNFQGRYAIRHEWKGKLDCKSPVRGRWGGPWPGEQIAATQAATELAFAPRGNVALPAMVAADVPEIGVKANRAASSPNRTGAGAAPPSNTGSDDRHKRERSGCACEAGAAPGELAGSAALLVLALALAWRPRRRRARG